MNPRTVWLASYPKSGNTWFRAVYTAWRSGGPVDLNKLHAEGAGSIASSRVRIENVLGIPTSLLSHDEVDLLRPRVDEFLGSSRTEPQLDDTLGPTELDRATGKTTINKIHDALFPGPAGELIVSVAATRGAIYLIRDPRDVAVSYANHNRSSHDQAVAQMASPTATLSGHSSRVTTQVRQRLGTWSEHVCSWIDDAPFPVHVVRYEDCTTHPVPVFATAFGFAGHEADPDDVAVAVEHTRFDRLRSQEIDGGFRERPTGVQSFFRRGEAGGWRDDLEPELAARIESDHEEVMRRFGYLEPDSETTA